MTNMDTSDAGGVAAKNGFLFQDYAAAHCVIRMLRDKTILAVRCEVTDDIDIVYDGYEEHVQVKTKQTDRKWSLTELCEHTQEPKPRGKPRPPPKTDSIIHKSIQCHKNVSRPDTFRILSVRDVLKELAYLRSNPETRTNSKAKDDLVQGIKKKIGAYIGPGGTDIERWVDNATWEVTPALELIELRIRTEILRAAMERNVVLEPERDVQNILNDILVTLTKKSALSRAIYTADDKTYSRESFLEWFDNEILIIGENSSIYKKVYFNNASSKHPILVKFTDLGKEPQRLGLGIGQSYERGKYRYKYIARSIVEWIPELMLRPSELADNTGESLLRKVNLISSRLGRERSALKSLIGRVLMHSTLRHYTKSEPIPASLYVKTNGNDFDEFENIHIVRADKGDELWLGISELSEDSNLTAAVSNVASKIDILLSTNFDGQRQRLLEIKEDTYLSQHDIRELTDISNSIDDHISRFRFVIFLGYKSMHLTLERTIEESTVADHIPEARALFDQLIATLLTKDNFFKRMYFYVYLFPNPCLKTLQQTVEETLEETKYA